MSSIYDELSLEPAAAALDPEPQSWTAWRASSSWPRRTLDELLAEAQRDAEQITATRTARRGLTSSFGLMRGLLSELDPGRRRART